MDVTVGIFILCFRFLSTVYLFWLERPSDNKNARQQPVHSFSLWLLRDEEPADRANP